MLIDKRENQVDRLIGYLQTKKTDEENLPDLSEKDQDVLNRYIQLRALELKYTKRAALAIYSRQFGVSKSTTYVDYANMQNIFGNVERTNKDFRRELELLRLDELAVEAREAGDFKTAASIRLKIFEWTTKEENTAPFDPDDIAPRLVVYGQFPEQFKHNGLPKTKEGMEELLFKLRTPKNAAKISEEIEFREDGDSEA